MKLFYVLPVATLATFAPLQTQAYAEDDRELVKVSPANQTRLLAEMRVLLENVDDIVGALAEGDLKAVIKITDFEMGFGHNRLQKMINDGVPMEQVEEMRKKMQARRAQRGAQGGGHGAGNGRGLGQSFPGPMRDMGQIMHVAAGELSKTVKQVKEEPTASDYKAMLSNLQEITNACRACHVTFKVQ